MVWSYYLCRLLGRVQDLTEMQHRRNTPYHSSWIPKKWCILVFDVERYVNTTRNAVLTYLGVSRVSALRSSVMHPTAFLQVLSSYYFMTSSSNREFHGLFLFLNFESFVLYLPFYVYSTILFIPHLFIFKIKKTIPK